MGEDRFRGMEEAAEELAASLRACGISSGFSSKLGELCFSVGSVENAEYYFEKAVASDPGNADALNNLGVIRFHAGRIEEAERAFLEALRANPEKREAETNLSMLHAFVSGLAEGAARP